MVELGMKATGATGHKPQKGRCVWRLGSVDLRKKVVFPQDARMRALWEKHVPQGGTLQVLERWNDNSNNCIIEVARGVNAKRRQGFLDAVGAETKELPAA